MINLNENSEARGVKRTINAGNPPPNRPRTDKTPGIVVVQNIYSRQIAELQRQKAEMESLAARKTAELEVTEEVNTILNQQLAERVDQLSCLLVENTNLSGKNQSLKEENERLQARIEAQSVNPEQNAADRQSLELQNKALRLLYEDLLRKNEVLRKQAVDSKK